MSITYKETHDFTKEQLAGLFLSVNWSSGHFPDRLVTAMKNYETVISAWDGEMLVGMACAMDDGIMTAYIHYILVRPEYQGKGIGREILERVKEIYKDYLRVVLISYKDEAGFYESCGFERSDESCPMHITELWT